MPIVTSKIAYNVENKEKLKVKRKLLKSWEKSFIRLLISPISVESAGFYIRVTIALFCIRHMANTMFAIASTISLIFIGLVFCFIQNRCNMEHPHSKFKYLCIGFTYYFFISLHLSRLVKMCFVCCLCILCSVLRFLLPSPPPTLSFSCSCSCSCSFFLSLDSPASLLYISTSPSSLLATPPFPASI